MHAHQSLRSLRGGKQFVKSACVERKPYFFEMLQRNMPVLGPISLEFVETLDTDAFPNVLFEAYVDVDSAADVSGADGTFCKGL